MFGEVRSFFCGELNRQKSVVFCDELNRQKFVMLVEVCSFATY